MASVEDFFKQLYESGHVEYSYVAVSEMFRSHQTQLLYDIALAIDTEINAKPHKIFILEGTLRRILRTLTLDGNVEQVKLGIELEIETKCYSLKILAAMMAAKQPQETLLNVLRDIQNRSDEAYLEFAALIIQEMVIRGIDGKQHDVIVSYLDKLKLVQHPLAVLPLKLQSFESEIKRLLPNYNNDAVWGSSQIAVWGLGKPPSSSVPITVKEITSHFNLPMALSAFEDWTTRSNGITEFRVFHSDTELEPELLPSQILSLDLVALRGCTADDIFIEETTPKEVFERLFSAIAAGGAYSGGVGGASGRLKAWQSFLSLIGASFPISFEEIETRTKRCAWFLFSADSEWFYESHNWDFGVLVLQPDRKTLAVLAASDTDY